MSEKHYRQLEAICNNASVAFFLLDERHHCTYMNPAAVALTGYALEELQDHPLHDILHTGGSACSNACPLVRAFSEKNQQQAEGVLVHKGGRRIAVVITASPIRDGESVEGTVVEMQDATERKATEKSLRALKENSPAPAPAPAPADASEPLRRSHEELERQSRFLDAALSNIQSYVYVWDRDKRFVYANRFLTELWGLSAHEYLGKTTADLGFSPELTQRLDQQIEQVLESRQPVADEVFYTSPTGASGYYEYILSPVFDAQGRVELIAGISHDITERKFLEDALKEANDRLGEKAEERTRHLRHSEARYRTLFESMEQAFCVMEVLPGEDGATSDYRFIEVNPAFERQTGLTNTQGRTIRSLTPHYEDYWLEVVGQVAASGEPARFTYRSAALGDRQFDVYVFRVDPAETHQVAILFNDITERIQTEEQLKRAHGLIEGITAGTEDLIAAEDLEFRYLYFNDAYQREFKKLWGRELEVGTSMVEALAPWPEEQQKAISIWKRALAGETFSVTMEFGPSEERKYIYDLRFNPIRNEQGRTIGAAHIFRDVTRQMQFQRALRESEERYRLMARATNDVIWDWDLTSGTVEWNEAIVKQFGWKPEELKSHVEAWYARIHPDDRERVQRGIETAINSGEQSWSDEYRFRKADGSYALLLDRGYIAHDVSGRAHRMIGSMLDLTERRRTEQTLIQAAAADAFRIALADALRPLADPVIIQSVASRVLGQHLAANRVHYGEISEDGRYGLVQTEYRTSAQSVVGQHRLDDYSPAILEEFHAGQTIIITNTREDSRLKVRNTNRPPGAYVVVPLVKAGTAVAAFIVHQASPREWTEPEIALIEETAERTWAAVERARVEKALRASEEQFRLLTDGIPHMVWLADAQGRFAFLNRQFTTYTGATDEPLVAEAFVERFVHPDDIAPTMSAWQTAVQKRQALFVEHRIRSAVGHYSWFAARAEPQINRTTGEIERWFGTMTNIEDRKLAEKTLKEADRQKDEFIAMLAHELRNPLAAVRNVERLLAPKATGDTEAQRYIEILRRQTATLTELVEDLLDVSRVTRGLVELKQEHVDLAKVARHALESVQALMDEKHHKVEVGLPQQPLVVTGDAVRLEQIVVNLLTNAAKYTDPGGIIALKVMQRSNSAELYVRDTGIGMTAEEIDRVFTLFGQAERGLDRAQGGLGLGLTIVRNLVELHGGEISSKSKGLGKGAEFRVRLPLVTPAEATVLDAAIEGDMKPGGPKNVLLVEDSQDVAETMALLLEASGHQVTVAHDGPNALTLVEQLEPDVILLDIGLPGMDGFELAACLQQTPSADTAVLVALTGYGQPRDRARTEAAGFHAHFVKPVDIHVLQTFINNV